MPMLLPGHHAQRPPLAGRYTLLEEAGRGKTGTVFRAWDGLGGEEVALKLGAENDFVRMVMGNEALAMGKVEHPGVAKFRESGESEGGRFIAMEFVRGVNLKRHLHDNRFSPALALAMARDVCAALEELHSRGVVHRDIKPKNAMVGPDGRIKLIDFGYAFVGGAEDVTKSFTHSIGSPIYSPPEDTRGNGDPRIDIYSAGMMLYEMLMRRSGLYLLDAVRIVQMRRNFYRGVRERMGCSGAFGIVMQATEREPANRFQTAKEMREGIERIIDAPN